MLFESRPCPPRIERAISPCDVGHPLDPATRGWDSFSLSFRTNAPPALSPAAHERGDMSKAVVPSKPEFVVEGADTEQHELPELVRLVPDRSENIAQHDGGVFALRSTAPLDSLSGPQEREREWTRYYIYS